MNGQQNRKLASVKAKKERTISGLFETRYFDDSSGTMRVEMYRIPPRTRLGPYRRGGMLYKITGGYLKGRLVITHFYPRPPELVLPVLHCDMASPHSFRVALGVEGSQVAQVEEGNDWLVHRLTESRRKKISEKVLVVHMPDKALITGIYNPFSVRKLIDDLTFVNPSVRQLFVKVAGDIDRRDELVENTDVQREFRQLAKTYTKEYLTVSWMRRQVEKGVISVGQWEAFTYYVFSRAWRIYNIISGGVTAVHIGGFSMAAKHNSDISSEDGGSQGDRPHTIMLIDSMRSTAAGIDVSLKNLAEEIEKIDAGIRDSARRLAAQGIPCRCPDYNIDRAMSIIHAIRRETSPDIENGRLFSAGNPGDMIRDFERFQLYVRENGLVLPGVQVQEDGLAEADPWEIFKDACYFYNLVSSPVFESIEMCARLALSAIQPNYETANSGFSQLVVRLEAAGREARAGREGPIDAFEWGLGALPIPGRYYHEGMEYVREHTDPNEGRRKGYAGSTEDRHASLTQANVGDIIVHASPEDIALAFIAVAEVDEAQIEVSKQFAERLDKLVDAGAPIRLKPNAIRPRTAAL